MSCREGRYHSEPHLCGPSQGHLALEGLLQHHAHGPALCPRPSAGKAAWMETAWRSKLGSKISWRSKPPWMLHLLHCRRSGRPSPSLAYSLRSGSSWPFHVPTVSPGKEGPPDSSLVPCLLWSLWCAAFGMPTSPHPKLLSAGVQSCTMKPTVDRVSPLRNSEFCHCGAQPRAAHRDSGVSSLPAIEGHPHCPQHHLPMLRPPCP